MTHLSTLVEIAANLRRQSRLYFPPFSTTQLVERCFPDAVVTGRKLPAGVLEAVSRTPQGPVILYARGLSPTMQRYAIAHAIGHLVFDEGFRNPGEPAIPRVERRADAFADELLVPFEYLEPRVKRYPAPGVRRDLYFDHVDQLASQFSVESTVIDRRIRQLTRLVRIRA